MRWMCCFGVLLLVGCGPLLSPMPVRLEQKDQDAVERAWSRATTPANRMDRQTMLDALLTTRGYECGIDRLEFRSEKRCDAGVVVMEIHFDRMFPSQDRFTVQLNDHHGAMVRREDFYRDEVERTCKELFEDEPMLRKQEENHTLTRDQADQLERLKKRGKLVAEAMPQFPKVEVMPDKTATEK